MERRQRAAFIASLSPADQEALRGFETVNRNWRAFRDLSPTVSRRALGWRITRAGLCHTAASPKWPSQAGVDSWQNWARDAAPTENHLSTRPDLIVRDFFHLACRPPDRWREPKQECRICSLGTFGGNGP